jgi:DNA-binding transcriptional LysR family regulator
VRLHQPRDDDDMVRRVLDGRCELAVTHLPVQRAGLKLTLLGTQQIGVLLPPGTPPGPDPLPITALDGLPIIDSMRGYDTVRAVVRDALRRAGVRMRRSVVTFHPESIVPLVIAGGGAAFVNDRYAREGAMAGVTVRRLHPAITCDVGLLHREGTLSPASRGFTDVLLEETAVLREFA